MSTTAAPARPRAKRPKRPRETTDLAAGIARQVQSVGRRAGVNAEELQCLQLITQATDAAMRAAIQRARTGPDPWTWQQIADFLGVTRQAVQARYGGDCG